MRVRHRLAEVALDRNLSRSTVVSYRRMLTNIGIIDTPMDDLTVDDVLEAVIDIPNTNTRRSTIIAVRSVTGLKLKIPKGIRRRYDLPDAGEVVIGP